MKKLTLHRESLRVLSHESTNRRARNGLTPVMVYTVDNPLTLTMDHTCDSICASPTNAASCYF